MTNKRKKLARDLAEKTGVSYAGAINMLNASIAAEPRQPHADDAGGKASITKYLHVEYGTAQGTVWLLSDDPTGAALSVSVPDGPLTLGADEEAFAHAVYPLINETSDDGGRTWIQHLDVEPQRDWLLARRLIYSLLGSGGGRWNAARIRARTGEDLVRHPSILLQDVASQIQVAFKDAQLTLQPPNHQLFVRTGIRMFALSTSMKRAADWPVYVTPIPPPSETEGSWECFSIDDVLATLRWPSVRPTVRVVSVADIRAGRVGSPPAPKVPMRRDVIARRLGNDPPDAHIVQLRFDAAKGEGFDDALREAGREARERPDLLEVGIRRMDRPGHPWVCSWRRDAAVDPWTFSWRDGADDARAPALSLGAPDASGAFVYGDRTGGQPTDGFFVGDGRGEGTFVR